MNWPERRASRHSRWNNRSRCPGVGGYNFGSELHGGWLRSGRHEYDGGEQYLSRAGGGRRKQQFDELNGDWLRGRGGD